MTKCQKCYTVVQITLKIFLLNVYHHLIKLITPWLSSFFFFFFSVLPSSGRSLAPTLSTTLYPQPSSSILHLFFFFLFSISFSSSSFPSFSFLFSCPLSPLFSPSPSSAPSFGSLFFFLIFGSLIASFRSLIIPSLGLPVRFFPTILPSNTSLNNPSRLNTCPIQFFFLFVIVSIRHLFSFTIVNTSSLLTLSTQLIFFNPPHNHISSACNLLISSCSCPYSCPCSCPCPSPCPFPCPYPCPYPL